MFLRTSIVRGGALMARTVLLAAQSRTRGTIGSPLALWEDQQRAVERDMTTDYEGSGEAVALLAAFRDG